MANILSKRDREKANKAYLKMRSAYRSTAPEQEIVFNAADFVDGGKAILHGPRLKTNQGLPLQIPRWTNTPPPGTSDRINVLLDRGDGKGFVSVADHTFTRPSGQPDFSETFPYEMLIPLQELPRDADCQLKYSLYSYNDEETESDPVLFLCDQVKPYNDLPPQPLQLASPFLDDTNLPPGGKLQVTIPTSAVYQWKDGDWIAIYVFDVNNIPPDPSVTTPIYYEQLLNPATTPLVQIDAQKIRDLGDAKAVFLYVIRDKSQNDSVLSLWLEANITLGPLPTLPLDAPRVPQAVPGPLLLEHVLDGVSVWITRPTAFKPGDLIELKWGSTTVVKDFPIPDNGSAEIEVPVTPSKILLLEYGQTTAGEKDTVVSYSIHRKGRPFGPATATIKVELEVPIPWLPWPPEDEWPIPGHPSLSKGTVKNYDGTKDNKLERSDKNQEAFFTFKWHTEAENGHTLNFDWNGQRVTEAELVFDDTPPPGPGHMPGADVQVEIPWEYIKEGKNGPEVPVQYWLSKAGLANELPSEKTLVDVSAIAMELPQPSFPKVSGHYPGCKALEDNGDLQFSVPDLSAELKDGATITVEFIPMTGEDLTLPETPIAGAKFEKTYVLGTDGDLTGFVGVVTPYDKHIQPLYDETAATNRRGRMKLLISHHDGTENIESEPLVIITAFHAGSGECPITP